jgi:hypothetical protein
MNMRPATPFLSVSKPWKIFPSLVEIFRFLLKRGQNDFENMPENTNSGRRVSKQFCRRFGRFMR